MRFLLFILLAIPLHAATYYVATDGSDANPGTEESPWLTVQHGLDTAVAGDTVLLGAGTYAEDVQSIRNGSEGSTITVDGQGVATVHSFLILHARHNLLNMTISGKTNGWLIYMYPGADFCTISNNVVDGQLNDGLPLVKFEASGSPPFGDAGSNNLIVSNTFQNCRGTTVAGCFGDFNTYYGNRLINSDAVDWFRVFGRTNSVVGNVCSNVYVTGISGYHPDFFQVFGQDGYGSQYITIESNLVIKMDDASQLCMFEGQDEPEIHDFDFRNNIFVGIAAKGTMGVRNVRWHNNTFIRCSTNGPTVGATLIFTVITNATYTNWVSNSGHGGEVKNNVFLDCGGAASMDRGWYTFELSLTNIVADYNFVSKNGYQSVTANPDMESIGDPGGWDNFQWWEDNGINGGNPLLVNEISDFRPQIGSPLLGAGQDLSATFTTDYIGVTRSAWSIGAYEEGVALSFHPIHGPRHAPSVRRGRSPFGR